MILNRERIAVLSADRRSRPRRVAGAQQKPLTIDAIYDPQAKAELQRHAADRSRVASDTHYLQPGPPGSAPLKVDAVAGTSEPLFEAARLETALGAPRRRHAGGRQAGGPRAHAQRAPAATACCCRSAATSTRYDLGAHRAARLTNGGGTEDEAGFSPDGTLGRLRARPRPLRRGRRPAAPSGA